MNIALWTLQIMLALHTVAGAVWKFSNSERTVPSLGAIPHGLWLSLSVVELLCSLALVIPLRGKPLAPVAAATIAAIMLLYCGVHLASGDPQHAQLAYWLVVAAVCGFIAYGRLALKPL